MKCCEFALDSGEFEILYRDNPSVILRFRRKMTAPLTQGSLWCGANLALQTTIYRSFSVRKRARLAARPLGDLSYGFCVFRGGNAELFLELTGEVMHCGVLQCRGNLRKVQIVLPDHLLALLELDPADILAGG